MRKLSESVWMDIHKHSNGDVERKEDDIDLCTPEQLYEYILLNYRDKFNPEKPNIFFSAVQNEISITVYKYNNSIQGSLSLVLNFNNDGCAELWPDNTKNDLRAIPEWLIKDIDSIASAEIKHINSHRPGNNWGYCIFTPKDGKRATNRFLLSVFDFILDWIDEYSVTFHTVFKKKKKVNESVWVDIHKQSTGDKLRREDDVNLLTTDGLYQYLIDHYRTVGINQSIGYGDTYLNIPLFVLNPSYRKTNCGILWDYKKNRVQIKGSYSIWPQPLKNLLQGRYKMRTEFFSKRSEVKLFTRREGETNNDFLLEVIDAILSKAEYPVLEKI